MTLPTPRSYLGIHTVYAFCADCNRPSKLDLEALVAAGHGDKPLIELPLTCGVCGRVKSGIIVSGRDAGFQVDP